MSMFGNILNGIGDIVGKASSVAQFLPGPVGMAAKGVQGGLGILKGVKSLAGGDDNGDSQQAGAGAGVVPSLGNLAQAMSPQNPQAQEQTQGAVGAVANALSPQNIADIYS
jgi:hypothetical protein